MRDATVRAEHTTTTNWMRLGRGAAITMVVWSVVLQITAGQLIPPVFAVGLVFLGFAPFLTGERRRLGLLYTLVAGLAIIGNLPVIIDELAHPDSAPAFILTLLSVIAATTAIGAGLGAFFRWPTAPIRAFAISGATVFVLGALASITLAASAESHAALAGDAIVVSEQVEFVPDTVTVRAGAAGLWVDNKDGIRHTLTIEELGVDLEIPALKARRVDFAAEPGTYTYICTVPGHENMTGTLVVEG